MESQFQVPQIVSVAILRTMDDSREMVLGRTLLYLFVAQTPGNKVYPVKVFVYKNTDTHNKQI